MRRRLPALLAAAALVGGAFLAGCSSSPDEVSVSGTLGEQPTVTIPDSDPSGEFEVSVLKEGDGETVEEGDLLVARYVGQIWDSGEVFDNSYDSGQPRAFGIGVGEVVSGWDEGLVGKKVGSRVLLVLPPDKGYGEAGNAQAGIEGTDTLVFVVDIVDRFPRSLGASGTPVADVPATVPTVQVAEDGTPTLEFSPTATAPATTTAALVLNGDGEPLDLGKTLAMHVVQHPWGDPAPSFSSRETAPIAMQVGQLPGMEAALQGQNVGSRVVLSVSGADTGGDPVGVIVDVIGTF